MTLNVVRSAEKIVETTSVVGKEVWKNLTHLMCPYHGCTVRSPHVRLVVMMVFPAPLVGVTISRLSNDRVLILLSIVLARIPPQQSRQM